MSAIKWVFAVGALLIGAALVGVFAQMASQVLDFTLPEQVTEPKVETAKNEIKNITKNQTYKMRPFPDLIGKIIAAGGLFHYKSD